MNACNKVCRNETPSSNCELIYLAISFLSRSQLISVMKKSENCLQRANKITNLKFSINIDFYRERHIRNHIDLFIFVLSVYNYTESNSDTRAYLLEVHCACYTIHSPEITKIFQRSIVLLINHDIS